MKLLVKSFEESGLLIKAVSETIKNKAKEKKGGFLRMLLGTVGVRLLGNQLEQVKTKIEQARIFNASSFHKFWNTKVLSNEPKFKGVYSRNNLPKMKDEAYVINYDEFKSMESHWIALYVNGNTIF